jgi:hypothetical protein
MPSPLVLLALFQVADVTLPTGPRLSSAQDCEIMAMAGKEVLGWGSERPKYAYSRNTNGAKGALLYVANCVGKTMELSHQTRYPRMKMESFPGSRRLHRCR